MTDHTPAFAEVFGGGLFPAGETAASPLAAADLVDIFHQAERAPAGGDLGAGAPRARFEGDTSQLPPEACWTLQELVAAPHIREGSGRYWAALLRHEDVLRSRLSELGLVLEISRERGYAFTRQAADPSPHARTLLRARTLSLAASTLALYLYNQYLIAPDDPVVETDDMIDHMFGYKPDADTDEAGFRRRILAAIRSLEEASIIKPVPGTRRFIIYGVITSLLSAERVEALNARYRVIAAGTAAGDGREELAGGDLDPDPGDGGTGEAAAREQETDADG